MNNKIISILIVIVLIVVGIFLFRSQSVAPTQDNPGIELNDANPGFNSVPLSEGNVREIIVNNDHFSFDPSSITVKRGDTVRITFNNTGGTHDWRLDEFNAATQILKAGESETIEFVADKTGSFEYYCSVGEHRQLGMRGTLTVTE